MAFVAVIGSGPLGGHLAQKIARRDRVAEVRLIDSDGNLARGKALDILQSGPVEQFSTRVTAADSIDAAAGAHVIVLADAASGQEHSGESGLAIVRRFVRAGAASPIVCAGAQQQDVIARSVSELRVDRRLMLGSAPGALESALRALAGLALDGSGVEVSLRVLGRPPRAAVVAWESASIAGQPLSSQLPPHALAGLSSRIPGLWPLGPYALASAAALVVEALIHGSRRSLSCFVALDAGLRRSAVASVPVSLGPNGVRQFIEPSLTRQERTMVENAVQGTRQDEAEG
jgi:malate dehydrogenase